MNFAKNTTTTRLFLVILFSFLTVVDSRSVAIGDFVVAPRGPELPIVNPNFVPKPGIGTKAVTPPHFGLVIPGGVAGKSRAALMTDGKVYVHHHHLAAQQLAGKAPKPGDLYGFATLDELGNVIRVDWVPIKP